jgi:thioredoxin-like negative regulator of GroEL
MTDLHENVKSAATEQGSELAEDDSTELLSRDAEASCGPGFERQLDNARNLLQNSDLEGAFKALQDLEAQFIAASSLFGLLGDVLIRKGNVEEGIHYKQLYQILSRTLQIARGAKTARDTAAEHMTSSCGAIPMLEEDLNPDPEYTPLTAAMAHELMRQGHFDKAAEILHVLVEQNPDDESLREVRDRADKEVREDRLLRTLGGWLNNIEKIKASRDNAE